MNYNKNIPEWQQYNALPPGAPDSAAVNMAAAPGGQNVNPNSSFVPSISTPSINNVNSDCIAKPQNDANYGSRNYAAHPNGPNSFNMGQSPLTPMVHMSNCIGHYGNSANMNPLMDDINNDMEPHRNPIAEEIGHRNNPMPINGPTNHMIGSNMNMNNNMNSGPRIPPNNPMMPNRQTPFVQGPCKASCCIPDPNMAYSYGSYSHAAPYRENMHLPNYNQDDRRYRSSVNYRKEAYQSKTKSSSNQYLMDHRMNYPDYKYRKEAAMQRNYQQSPVILPNYGLQNYNNPNDYMKYHHYPSRGGHSMPNPPNNSYGMIKFHDMTKHPQYQNSNVLQNVVPNVNMPSMQNSYYNQPNGHREYLNETRDPVDPNNTKLKPSSGPYAKHQMYRQKFAIQRFTLENQLKEMTRIPGYLSNPKYQECMLRYRELLKLQRTVEFQSSMQESSMNANANSNINMGPPISPINLQFDHNGVLINSNFLPTGYQGMNNQIMNSNANAPIAENSSEVPDAMRHQQNIQILDQTSFPPGQQKTTSANQEPSVSANSNRHNATQEPQQNKTNKDFADKPDLDVRQFLATWDESEEEENTVANVIGKDTTPVTVVEFADLNLVTNLTEVHKELELIQENAAVQNNGAAEFNNGAKVVSVVGCISTGNEVPTIHIVDNLENKIVMEKIDGALNEIHNANIKCIRELINNEILTNNKNEKQVLEESQQCVPQITQNLNDISKNQNISKPNETNSPSGNTTKTNSDNVELNNPDDLSLPELTTYECTPMSTTLNTPTHSDNEESLEHVARLSIPTNPIEVDKNSPIISFTQTSSENKQQQKSSQESLNFDLGCSSNVINNYSETPKTNKSDNKNLDGNMIQQRSDQKSNSTSETAETTLSHEWFSSIQSEKTDKCDVVQPALSLPTIVSDDIENTSFFATRTENVSNKVIEISKTSSITDERSGANLVYPVSENNQSTSNVMENKNKSHELSMENHNESIEVPKKVSIHDNINAPNSHGSIIDKEEKIWKKIEDMQRSLEMNLSSDHENFSKENQISKRKLKKLLKNKAKKMSDFKKIKHLLKNDLKRFDLNEKLYSKSKSNVFKSTEDTSSPSTSADVYKSRSFERRGSKDYGKRRHLDSEHRRCDSPRKVSKNHKRRSKSVEPNIQSDEQVNLLEEFQKLKRKRSIDSSFRNETQKLKETIDQNRENKEKNQLTKLIHLKSDTNDENNDNKLVKCDQNKALKDFEIQVANLNFRINENDFRKGLLALKDENQVMKEAIEGIKIEINLSCSDNTKLKSTNCEDSSESSTKTVSKKNYVKLDNDSISTSHCDRLSFLKSNTEVIEDISSKSSQNVKLPQTKTISSNNCNDYLLPNISECLKSTSKNDLTDKSLGNLSCGRKQTNSKLNIFEVNDQLKLLNNSFNSNFPEELYSSKVFDYTKDSAHIYNMQNIKNPKLLPSLNMDTLSIGLPMNMDNLDLCNNFKQSLTDKSLNPNFAKSDLLCKINPLAFKNYASENNFSNELYEEESIRPNGFFNPAFMDNIDQMDTVPIYTTKDGKIKYSPNRRYTYKILLMENEKFFETTFLNRYRYSMKSRDRKKHKSKHLEGKLHKPKDCDYNKEVCKYQPVINKSPPINKKEPMRDCSVIAVAPSYPVNEPKLSPETSIVENDKNESDTNENVESDPNFQNPIPRVTEETLLELNTFQDENHYTVIENRSTVIKQLGNISQNHKDLDENTDIKNTASIEEFNMETSECTSVICMDYPNSIKSTDNCNLLINDKDSMPSTSIISLSLAEKSDSVIKKDTSSENVQNNILFKNTIDERPSRRHSTSTIVSMEQNAKSRRKSFESDIIITSIFHDSEHDYRDNAITQIEDVLKDNVFENVSAPAEKNDEGTEISKDLEIIPQSIEIETEDAISKQAEINHQEDKNYIAITEVIDHDQTDDVPVTIDNDDNKNRTPENILNRDKVNELPTQKYIEYDNVIIKEEDEVEEEVETNNFPDLEKEDSIPEIDKEDDISPLEHVDFDSKYTSDSESIECPTLESQVENIPTSFQEIILNRNEDTDQENVLFKNENSKTGYSSIKPTLVNQNSLEDNTEDNVDLEELPQLTSEKERVVPKLVIKKSDSLSKIFSRAKSFNIEDESCRNNPPKIPKMIIRNAGSRPETPIIKEISVLHSRDSSIDDRNLKSKSTYDDKSKTDYDFDTKVPKMKINFENELPKVVIENIDIQTIQKTVPKMKIKKVKSLRPHVIDDKVSRRSKSSDDRKDESESRRSCRELIPKLKIRKDSSSKKRSRSSSSHSSSKRSRRYSKDREDTANLSEYECNTNDIVPVSEKIPKVIIKRTSTKSEFKCELSKNKGSELKWQPRVTLNRSWILDTMAREFRHMKVALKLTTPRNVDRLYAQSNIDSNKLKWDKFLSDLKKQKMSNLNSEVISFDITTSSSRKRKNVVSISRNYTDSEDSDFNLLAGNYDENMNSNDSMNNELTKRICGFEVSNVNNEFTNDVCSDDISTKKSEKTNHLVKLHPVDESHMKKNSSAVNRKMLMIENNKEEDNCVIELESSDESQTTIEILPATPDTVQEDLEPLNKKLDKEASDEDLPILFPNIPQESSYDDNAVDKSLNREKTKSPEKHSSSRSVQLRSKHHRHPSSSRRKDSDRKKHKQSSKSCNDKLSYSDLLAKEVLAAKETLRQCFTRCRNENNLTCNVKPKIVEEETNCDSQNHGLKRSSDDKNSSDRKKPKISSKDDKLSQDRHHRQRSKSRSKSSRRSRSRSTHKTISLKQMKNAELSKKSVSSDMNHQVSNQKAMRVIGEINQMISENKVNNVNKDNNEESKSLKEENMPILEPQVNVDYSSSPDRDSSRSPPVITNQDSIDIDSVSPKEQLLKLDLYENESRTKNIKTKQDSELTIADIVHKLAFHEKATIKHRRYCTLCERWFPSVIRHEKHLSGYQHRHMELMQRRTIHTLYTLFTGKPCPKLLPANMRRVDCSIGEPTPLQIVVQDIVIDCDDIRSDKKKHEKSNT